MDHTDQGAVPIYDLLGNTRYMKPGGKILDERSALIGFFATRLQVSALRTGVRLAHYNLQDLYTLKSQFEDRWNRNGIEAARKYFYWMTRTTKHEEKDQSKD